MVTQRGDPLYRSEETTVMVQEDQAEEPWSSYYDLYTIGEGFKAPPESRTYYRNDVILGQGS